MTSTVTPVMMASCMSRTWEKTRCGQPNRRGPRSEIDGAFIVETVNGVEGPVEIHGRVRGGGGRGSAFTPCLTAHLL